MPDTNSCGSFHVVGVGASAGGLDAFSEILKGLPPGSGLAIVLIQHLDPKHTSLLTELLQRNARMRVIEAADGMQVQPDTAYVIPPNVVMTIVDKTLRLTGRPASGQHMPIDTFFESLAKDLGECAIGVVLSGTATDGTVGLRANRAEGGITFAQDPATSAFSGMPRNAIASGSVDFVLAPAEIGSELPRFSRRPRASNEQQPESVPGEPDSRRYLQEIFAILRAATNVDFAQYKKGTIRRRILRRLALRDVRTLQEYVRLLSENRQELAALFQDLLINVTAFFREPETFDLLKSVVYPELMRNRRNDQPLRIWVPGCASGEDVYSMAITVDEFLAESGMSVPVQLFGTDLSDAALEHARAGIYPEGIASATGAPRLGKYFRRVPDGYQISSRLREMCIFARQNLANDPPFSRLDILVCRNLLIYFGPILQKKAIRLFHYAINSAGFLVLGNSETIGTSSELFIPLNRHNKIYRRRNVPGPVSVEFESNNDDAPNGVNERAAPMESASDLQKCMDRALLAGFAPPSVLVNRDLRVLQFRGNTSRYLEHPSGEATLHLMKMGGTGLVVEIRSLIEKSDRDSGSAQSAVLSIPVAGKVEGVRLSVMPVESNSEAERKFLVVFEEPPHAEAPDKAPASRGESKKMPRPSSREQQLKQELASTRKYLESVIEDQEAITEELKSANEEIQSSNEELQSTNEELLTAKEELQSINEELTTVNEQMQNRNEDLLLTNDDLFNLLSSINIPIVMLGTDLRVRRFTPQAERILNLLPSDIGRPISDFNLKINLPDVDNLVRGVLHSLEGTQREVQDLDGRTYSMWIRPYRTADHKIDGAVLALFDITDRRQIPEARFRRLFDTARDGIILADMASGNIVEVNPYACRVLGARRLDLIGKSLFEAKAFEHASVFAELAGAIHGNELVMRDLRAVKHGSETANFELIGSIYHEGERRMLQLTLRDADAVRAPHTPGQRDREAIELESAGRVARFLARRLGNDLTTILIGCDVVLREHAGTAIATQIEKIREAANHVAAAEKQLLAFGRIAAANRNTEAKKRLRIDEVIEGMEPLIAVALGNDAFEIRRTAADLWPVELNLALLERLILNLTVNAWRSMDNSGQVVIETANAEIDSAFSARHPSVQPGRYALLTITNSAGKQNQEDASRQHRRGIPGVPETLDEAWALGAQVRAFSEMGVGSAVSVYFPRADAKPEAAEIAKSPGKSGDRSLSIVVADTNDASREATALALRNLGHNVYQAENGSEAVAIASDSSRPVDLIIAEASGKVLNGVSAKILYVSGEPDDILAEMGIPEEPEGILRKPYSVEQLADAVRRVFNSMNG